jgi:NADH-quinone oxidoreductase subunit L
MHEEQDIRKYGGLKKYMPYTSKTFLIAAIAIAGIPPFAGFFSKDEILWKAFSVGGAGYWIVGVITALFTAFYMFRLYFLTFEGKSRFDEHHVHPHESAPVMTIPLVILAFLSIFGGFLGMPAVFVGEGGNVFAKWLEPVFKQANNKFFISTEHSHFTEILLMAISVAGAALAIYFARYIYLHKQGIADRASVKLKGLYSLLLHKYYVDEAYDTAIVSPIFNLSDKFLWKVTDVKLIDGLLNKSAKLVEVISNSVKKMQTGITQFYAVIMMTGILLVLLWIIKNL